MGKAPHIRWQVIGLVDHGFFGHRAQSRKVAWGLVDYWTEALGPEWWLSPSSAQLNVSMYHYLGSSSAIRLP